MEMSIMSYISVQWESIQQTPNALSALSCGAYGNVYINDIVLDLKASGKYTDNHKSTGNNAKLLENHS
jgi:hypothetical protein